MLPRAAPLTAPRTTPARVAHRPHHDYASLMPHPRTRLLAAPLACLALTGCVERRIEITSEPPGALVWLNDQQIGRTPAAATFLYHGVYDVRLHLDGYEPLATRAETDTPIYEHAPLDLVAEALPARIENVQRWHFVLQPALETQLPREQLETDLLHRAAAMRADVEAMPLPERHEEAEPQEPALDEAEAGAEPSPPRAADNGADDQR